MEPINLSSISTDESILALVCSIVAAIVSTYIEKKLDSKKEKEKDDKLIEKMFNRDDLLISDILEQNKQLRVDNKDLHEEIDKLQENLDYVTNCSSSVDIKS